MGWLGVADTEKGSDLTAQSTPFTHSLQPLLSLCALRFYLVIKRIRSHSWAAGAVKAVITMFTLLLIIPQARTGTEVMYHGELHPSHDQAVFLKTRDEIRRNTNFPWSSEGPLLKTTDR
jgi:hypothetical protein